MEKPSFGKNGVLRLPPGFRFHPTDEELVVQYLKRKVHSCPLPSSIIPEINLSKYNPWDLPGGCEEERYFFHLSEAKYPSGGRRNRATRSGYWKATGKEKEVIVASNCGNRVVGMKRVLVFHQGRKAAARGIRTNWVMHEYRLIGTETSNLINSSMFSTNGWVLCRIFKKRSAAEMHPSSPSASESSCVTELCDGSGEEASSSMSVTSAP
ncbi:NAC domain-containing protein 83-like [Typha angustifolia]|uniref:NAC domain-containing protein 83-like n=1 Tax=Typha angustifolia TaxID=59011 RepID=UPI003C304520